MTDKPRRRWFRFQLRTLLMLVAVLAIPLAWITNEWRQTQHELRIAAQLREQEIVDFGLGGPYDRWLEQDDQQGWWRDVARKTLGERILWIQQIGSQPDSFDLTPLAGLKNLQSLRIEDGAQVRDLSPLIGLTQLRWFHLDYAPIRDLGPLAGLKNLHELNLTWTLVSDLSPLAGLTQLEGLDLKSTQVKELTPMAGLKNLKRLNLSGTKVSEEEVARLQQALPNCKIVHGMAIESR